MQIRVEGFLIGTPRLVNGGLVITVFLLFHWRCSLGIHAHDLNCISSRHVNTIAAGGRQSNLYVV